VTLGYQRYVINRCYAVVQMYVFPGFNTMSLIGIYYEGD